MNVKNVGRPLVKAQPVLNMGEGMLVSNHMNIRGVGRPFSAAINVLYIKSTHTGKKPPVCRKCGKAL